MMWYFNKLDKSEIIEAIQLVLISETPCKFGVHKEYNSILVGRFIGGIVRFPTKPNGTKQGRFCVEVETPSGLELGDVDDYIAKGVDGEFFVCKPNEFESKYEQLAAKGVE